MIRQALLATVLTFGVTSAWAQDAKSVIEGAQKSMGNPSAMEFSGTGMNAFFGQAFTGGKEWPRRDLESFKIAINYDQKAARQELNFTRPVFGGQRQNLNVNDTRAWTVAANGAAPQPAAAEERQLQIWMSPHGFLRGAAGASDAEVKAGAGGANTVTYTALNKYKVTGTISAQGTVTRVETLFPNPVLGDMPYTYLYFDYIDRGGVKFPARILQTQGGFAVNEFRVDSVDTKAKVDLPVPANVRSATPPPVRAQSSKIGEGIWFVGGGSHHSVVVEFDDYLTVIEAPQHEQRSQVVIAEAKKLAPNKPIRYVINTHNHFDHSGGLRAYVAEGATVVSHAANTPFWEQALIAPATLVPDAQSKAQKKPVIEGVTDKHVITDGKQVIEVHTITGDEHTEDLVIAYLPTIKAVVEADSYSPGPANAPIPNPPPRNAVVLHDNLQRLKLDVATIVGVHGRGPVPVAEFNRYVGK